MSGVKSATRCDPAWERKRGRARESVVGESCIVSGHCSWRPGEVDLSLANHCFKHLRNN